MSGKQQIMLAVAISALVHTSQAVADVSPAWTRSYNAPAGVSDEIHAIDLGPTGHIYVTGGASGDFETIRYSPRGRQIWRRTYTGHVLPGNDVATAIVVDDAGNAYVTGWSTRYSFSLSSHIIRSNVDFVTIKYTPDGTLEWLRVFNSGGTTRDKPVGIGLDLAGTVYVAGTSQALSSGNPRITTVKYDATGTRQWSRAFRDASARDLKVDPAGNVYIAGTSLSRTPRAATLKYDADGNLVWDAYYSSPITLTGAGTRAITIDEMGAAYVTGQTNNDEAETDYLVVKYDASGALMWAREGGQGGDYGSDIEVDRSGNVYVVGKRRGNIGTAGTKMFAAKFDPAGTRLWDTTYSDSRAGTASTFAKAVALDSAGAPHVTGVSCSAGVTCPGGPRVTTMKLNPSDGAQVWIGFEEHASGGAGNAIAVNGLFEVYVGGNRNDDYLTVKYGGVVRIEPPTIRFPGFPIPGVPVFAKIFAANSGVLPLSIYGIKPLSSACNAFRFQNNAFPVTLEPGQQAVLRVGFDPEKSGTYLCKARVVVEGAQPVKVTLEGKAELPQEPK